MLGTGTMSRRSGTCRTSSPNSTPRMPGRVGSRVSRCRHGRWVAAITFDAADLPEDVVALVDAHLLDLGGTYGVPERETRSSTTSYASSTTRATSRSSSTTAPSRLDVRAEAARRLQGTATRARTARAGGRRSAGDGETPRAGRGRVS